jgi:putative flippase GtrA
MMNRVFHLVGLRNPQMVRYVVVGGWNTLAGYTIFFACYVLLAEQLHYMLIALLSHVVATLNAWVCYRRLVFFSTMRWFTEYLRFNLSCGLLIAFQLFILFVLSGLLGVHPLVAQAVAIIISVGVSYLVHKHFSFGTGSES